MHPLRDTRDSDAQRYADRLMTDADCTLPSLLIMSHGKYLRPDEARREFASAKANCAPTVYAPSGPISECYPNVSARVTADGGEMVLGWQIMPHILWGEGLHLEAHAVWCAPDRQLIDVTVGRPSWQFAPSTRISERDQFVITTNSKEHAALVMRAVKAGSSTLGRWEKTRNPLA